ncbi:MAG: phospho-sugar mutase [Spirochaetaceae bacterium]|nr:phospho-sugar mutase [Spirochaetaceae bacterium]
MSELQIKLNSYLQQETNPIFLKEAEGVKTNEAELAERFSSYLAFGTGGMRGLIGAGYSRLNPYTIKRAGQGVANYLKKAYPNKPLKVAISYDTRNYSELFAKETALIFAANGFTAYLSDAARPVPLLSFAVRHYEADVGIMITASHNPPAYNGYKVYGSDGCQVLPPHDVGIEDEVGKVIAINNINYDEAVNKGLIITIGEQLDKAYGQLVQGLWRYIDYNPLDQIEAEDSSLTPASDVKLNPAGYTISYTPLHGSGYLPVYNNLTKAGFKVVIPEAQRLPDGNFPTVKVPNPEYAETLQLAIELAKKEKAALVLATDPDADRLGLAVLHNGEYKLLTGNQIGALLLDYLCHSRKEQHELPAGSYFANTIVTSNLQNLIAKSYGLKDYRLLTGFKYIGETIAKESGVFIFGCEESYGYLATPEVRDKDAVSAALLTAEMALYYSKQGKTLLDKLNELYTKFGYFEEHQVAHDFPGLAGLKAMQTLITKLRHNPVNWPEATVKIIDYLKDTDLPKSDVLEYNLAGGTKVIVRPSGTEPKIKFYILAQGEDKAAIDVLVTAIKKIINELLTV